MKKLALNALLCFAAGSLSALAMAPTNLWIILLLTLSLLYVALNSATSYKQSFLYAWLFGFGYFLFGLSWIGNALLVEGNPYAWAWPLAVCGLPFLLAFFFGGAGATIHRFSDLKTVHGYFLFVSIIGGFEWLRGHIFTGFPWNLFGYSWIDLLPVVQITHVGGVYFLTWLTVAWAAIGGFLFLHKGTPKKPLFLPAILIISFMAVYGYGALRLHNYVPTFMDDAQIKIVQPNIPQHEKWNRNKMTENFFKQLRMSYPSEPSEKATYIIWPETALSYQYANDPTSMSLLKQMLASHGRKTRLITGMLRRPDEKTIANSIVEIDSNGVINNIYDKHHLVPFGEYIPFQKWIPIGPIVNFSGFIMGEGLQTMSAPEGLRYSPLICYEAIFPGKAINGESRPDILINTTNDAWYGDSAGPRQHFTQAVFRAVEEGLPLARSANTGISALVNPVGQTIFKMQLFEDAVRMHNVPEKLKTSSFLPVLRNTLFFLALFASCGLAIYAKSVRKPKIE